MGSSQLDWIKAHKNGTSVLFFAQHEPAYATCAHDDEDPEFTDLKPVPYDFQDVLAMDAYYLHRNEYIEEIAPYATMLFSGYEHQYSRRTIDSNLYLHIPEYGTADDDTAANQNIISSFFEVKVGTAGTPIYPRINTQCDRGVDEKKSTLAGTYYYAVIEVDYENVNPTLGYIPAVSGKVYRVDGTNGGIVTEDGGSHYDSFDQQRNEQKIIALGDSWHYWKGDTPPPDDNSNKPWNDPAYDINDLPAGSAEWQAGETRIGYGTSSDPARNTELTDMKDSYTNIYMRKLFNVLNKDIKVPVALLMDYDDEFNAYINTVEVAKANCCTTDTPPLALGDHEAGSFERFPLDPKILFNQEGDPDGALANNANGTHVLAVVGYNKSKGSSDIILAPELRYEPADGQSHLLNEVGVTVPINVGRGPLTWMTASSPPIGITVAILISVGSPRSLSSAPRSLKLRSPPGRSTIISSQSMSVTPWSMVKSWVIP